jgi:zinc transport system substrate-binding protein
MVRWRHFALFASLILLGIACQRHEQVPAVGKLTVVTTLFPLYDLARNVGGEKVEVTLLLPPGVEPHSFEPKPDDIVRVIQADVFIYTNKLMEPWAADILMGAGRSGLLVVDSSAGATFLPAGEQGGNAGERIEKQKEEHHHPGPGMDPHIWLSIPNAQKMVDNIAAGLASRDPGNSDFYHGNAETYKSELRRLDRKFKEGLSTCKTRLFLHGGHYAFGYLADRYGLSYISAYAVSADAEPTPGQLVMLINQMKSHSLRYIFTEELISPRTAQIIAEETGAAILKLHGVHNVSREDRERGATYLSLMELNLESLRKGLQCR